LNARRNVSFQKFHNNIIPINIKTNPCLPAEYKNLAESRAKRFVNNKIALPFDSSYVLNINKMYFLSLLGYSGKTCIKKVLELNIRYWLPSHEIPVHQPLY